MFVLPRLSTHQTIIPDILIWISQWNMDLTVEQLTCDEPQTFATSDGYADCFGPTGITPMATGCEGPTTLLKEDNGDNRIWYVVDGTFG